MKKRRRIAESARNGTPESERVNKVISARLPPETLALIARILAAREISVATWITQHAVEDAAKLNP